MKYAIVKFNIGIGRLILAIVKFIIGDHVFEYKLFMPEK